MRNKIATRYHITEDIIVWSLYEIVFIIYRISCIPIPVQRNSIKIICVLYISIELHDFNPKDNVKIVFDYYNCMFFFYLKS